MSEEHGGWKKMDAKTLARLFGIPDVVIKSDAEMKAMRLQYEFERSLAYEQAKNIVLCLDSMELQMMGIKP